VEKDIIIEKLRENGCRITRQRRILLDIILGEDCTCCKEIYYKAAKQDSSIGMATVYRMVNTLEEIGAVSRKSELGFSGCGSCARSEDCQIEFEDGSVLSLSEEKWREVVSAGLKQCGYGDGKSLKNINEKNSQ
jgi:Fur family ferric uptake transcriptional regulator